MTLGYRAKADAAIHSKVPPGFGKTGAGNS